MTAAAAAYWDPAAVAGDFVPMLYELQALRLSRNAAEEEADRRRVQDLLEIADRVRTIDIGARIAAVEANLDRSGTTLEDALQALSIHAASEPTSPAAAALQHWLAASTSHTLPAPTRAPVPRAAQPRGPLPRAAVVHAQRR
eukprot:TRINITY_DN18375_c0_g2_i1.p4 TRINITY_DN18375_c0_g2~~TRINITY_DN18375_c0_g2_i1.p4  ORF type:complete len:142 (+),score=35.48 TRINITY_DN18375_c0_g2_i1:61-486(+)